MSSGLEYTPEPILTKPRFLQRIVCSSRPFQRFLPLAAIMAVYLLMATHHLTRQDLDGDELITAQSTSGHLSLRNFFLDRLKNGHPPIYFLLIRGWVGAFGYTSTTLLTFSVLLGAASVLIVYLLARELGLGRWAPAAALFWGMHPTIQFFARYARPYIGILLIFCAVLWLALRALRRQNKRAYGALFFAGFIGSGWNHLMLFLWAGIVLAILTSAPLRRRARPGFWAAMAGIFLSHLFFMALVAWATSAKVGKSFEWIRRPTLVESLSRLAHVAGAVNAKISHPSWQQLLPLLLLAAFILGLRRCIRGGPFAEAGRLDRSGEGEPPPAARWGMIAWATLTPLAIMILITYTSKTLLIFRYMTILVPGMILFLMLLLANLKSRKIAGALCALVAFLMAASIENNFRAHGAGLRDCIQKLDQHYQNKSEDIVVVFNDRTREAFRLLSRKKYNLTVIHYTLGLERTLHTLKKSASGKRRLWLIRFLQKNHFTENPEWLKLAGRQVFSAIFHRAELICYELPHASPAKVAMPVRQNRPSPQ